ncbi:MAG: phytanoyl-CoA dioxygenase family protein [Planctomycetota bacterium]|nr:phytanoyl-CoA dioxygenase family protein [Planctomycetota bacterium]
MHFNINHHSIPLMSVSIEDRFNFDLHGFLILRGALTDEECGVYLEELIRLEEQDYEDKFLEKYTDGNPGRGTKESANGNGVRLNGLPRLSGVFDPLIAHPGVVPFLDEFVGLPQLINTWSISKFEGCTEGGWHRGVPTTDYSFRNGDIRSRMLNVIFFLTDNGPEDGCVVAIPASHKSSFDLSWQDYPGLDMPGAIPVTGKAGDVFMFSEATIHNGLPKTTEGRRSNLYFNYVHSHYNVMTREPRNCHHFYLPPDVRKRFDEDQKKMTEWMEFVKWDH